MIGCLDGKHVQVLCPKKSGSMFFNYLKYFSVVLQGLVDSCNKFITVDVGGYGKQSDGGTFMASDLFKAIQEGSVVFPPPDNLPNTNITAPYVMLADEAYPLLPYLMTPFKRTTNGKHTHLQRAFVSCPKNSGVCFWHVIFKMAHLVKIHRDES